MALTQVTGPYPIFTDLDGSPLDDGYLYIGAVNQDPETNPIQAYWDSNLTIPATQPIRTNNGYAWRNGTPGLIYTAGQFSITIRNKKNEFVLYSPVGYGFDPGAVSASVVKNDFTGDGVETDFTLSASPSTKLATNAFINGVYQEKDSYTLLGNVITFSVAPPLGSSIEIITNETGVINSGNASAITYTFPAPGAVQQTVQTKLEQYVSVKDFGAVGDGVADDTAAIQAAIDEAHAQTGFSVYFPSGVYRTTSTLNISNSDIRLFGSNEYGATSYSPLSYTGSYIMYDANDGNPILKVGDGLAFIYSFTFENLRVGAAPAVTTKPIGIQMNACSEFSLRNFQINNNCSIGLDLNACFIGSVDNFKIAECDNSIRMRAATSTFVVHNSNVWFTRGNFWNCKYNHVLIINSIINITFDMCWMEYAQNMFLVEPTSDYFLQVANLRLNSVSTSVAVGYAPGTPGYSAANNRVFKAIAYPGGVQDLTVELSFTDFQSFSENSTYSIQYVRGTNTGTNSFLRQNTFKDCTFYGQQTSVFYSDTNDSTIFVSGRTTSLSAYGTGSIVPLSSGSERLNTMKTAFAYWDMTDGYPLRLPQVGALSYSVAGQVWYETTLGRTVYSGNGQRIVNPRPYVQLFGDVNATVAVATSAETLVFNTALSTNRTVTLSTTNAYNGAKCRITRLTSASGVSTLDVGGLKTLAAGQWCDVEYDGSSWVVTAFGSL